MDKFTVRVELHGVTSAEAYAQLHAAMGRAGFARTIRWKNDDVTYLLPAGEYNYTNESDGPAVVELARVAAATIASDFEILVTPVDGGRAKYNLRQAP